jgi:putative nucleotidyltransferase with HDIG domain/PAS domain S-box-containing protein
VNEEPTKVPDPIKVLIIEDSEADAALVSREILRVETDAELVVVDNAAALHAALLETRFDIVLSDYRLPSFEAPAALEMVRRVDSEVPFVVVSGTIGEERAVELMRLGVADYVLKDNLQRLTTVVDRAVSAATEHRLLGEAERHLITAALEWQRTFDSISDAVLLLDAEGLVTRVNASAERVLGRESSALVGEDAVDALVRIAGAREKPRLSSLRDVGCRHFEIGPDPDTGSWFMIDCDAIDGTDETPSGWVLVLSDITARKQAETELRSLVERLERAMGGSVSIAVHMVEKRDPYTAGHQEGVADIAVRIAKGLSMTPAQIEMVRTASLLHDIGKIAVPAEILVKPGRLDEYEWLIIQRHPQIGAEILEDSELGGGIAEIIRQHHERLDGSGYPNGLTDGDIGLEARIIAVADVAEAMLAHRPYRPARTLEETRGELLRGRGLLYDTDVVDACLGVLAQHPSQT